MRLFIEALFLCCPWNLDVKIIFTQFTKLCQNMYYYNNKGRKFKCTHFFTFCVFQYHNHNLRHTDTITAFVVLQYHTLFLDKICVNVHTSYVSFL